MIPEMEDAAHLQKELLATQNRLQESEKRFKHFFEHPALLYQSLDAEGRYREVNELFLQRLGYERSEVMGQAGYQFWPVEDRVHFSEQFAALKTQEKFQREQAFVCKNGTPLIFLVESSIQRDEAGQMVCTHCFLLDISERKKMEEDLRANEQQFRLLIENTPLPLVLSRFLSGEIVFANSAFRELFQLTIEDLAEMRTAYFFADPNRDRTRINQDLMEVGRVVRRDLRGRRKDGSLFDANLSSVIMDYEGRSTVVSVIYDLTNSKAVEDQLRQRSEELETFNRTMVDREMRIIELKEEVNRLSAELGRPVVYSPVWRVEGNV